MRSKRCAMQNQGITLIHLWEPKSNKNKILILQKCAFGLMFFGNFYE